MRLRWLTIAVLISALTPAWSFDIDRRAAKMRYVQFPAVTLEGLDFESVEAEIAYGETSYREPVQKTTKTICVPKGSKNKIKDAVELITHYLEIPYATDEGVIVVRDGDGNVLYSERLEGHESSKRFGYDQCEYWQSTNLRTDFELVLSTFRREVTESVKNYFLREAGEAIDSALFFNIIEGKVPVYTFQDKKRDYSDLNQAAELARLGYERLRENAGLGEEGRSELKQAVEIWGRALGESKLSDKQARINRKVTVKLHESIGAASTVLGDPTEGLSHLSKAMRLSIMSTSRTDGTGTSDLLQRAQRLKTRARRNRSLPEGTDLATWIAASDDFRDKVPVEVLDSAHLSRLSAEYSRYAAEAVFEIADRERDDRQAAVESGNENPYERMVGRTATQGFFLFLMPYPDKLDQFPPEICDLTHLNRLRVPNHRFESVPEEIGRLNSLEVLDLKGNRIRSLPATISGLEKLEKLDLTGNRIESLPEEIGKLENLKVLQLKGNPLASGEVQRLKQLLPGCKIKS